MSAFSRLFEGIREVLVMAERVEQATKLAEDAHRLGLDNRERIVRLETIIDLASGRGRGRFLPPK